MSNALRRLAPNLRGIGIQVEFTRADGKRVVALRTAGKDSVHSDRSDQNQPPAQRGQDSLDAKDAVPGRSSAGEADPGREEVVL